MNGKRFGLFAALLLTSSACAPGAVTVFLEPDQIVSDGQGEVSVSLKVTFTDQIPSLGSFHAEITYDVSNLEYINVYDPSKLFG